MSEHQNNPTESLSTNPTKHLSLSFFCSLKLECEKLATEKTEIQRHYVMVRQTCIHTHTQLSFASDARRIQTPDTIFLQPSIRSPSNAAHPSQRMSFQSRCHVPQCPQIWQLCAPGMPFALGRRLNPFSLSVFFLSFFFSSWLIFFLVWESPSNTVGSWQSW